MGSGELEFEIKVENAGQFTQTMNSFSPYMKNELYSNFVRIASKEENILKGTTGFSDVTGKLRRDLFVTATIHPLGIEGGTFTPYGKYVEYPHGTWRGGFWSTYKNSALPRIFEGISRALNKIVDKFNKDKSD